MDTRPARRPQIVSRGSFLQGTLATSAAGAMAAGFLPGSVRAMDLHAVAKHVLAANGTVNVGVQGDISDFNPHTDQLLLFFSLVRPLLYDALVAYDENLVLRPSLATSWSNPDARTFLFHLRQGVTFHNGKPFGAADVKHTFDLVHNPKTGSILTNKVAGVVGVDIVDDLTVRIRLKQPDAPFLADLSKISIVPRDADPSVLRHAPIGTGPFKFVSYSANASTVLAKNPNYWQVGLPKSSQVVIKVITDPQAELVNLRGGAVDIITQLPIALVKTVQSLTSAKLYQVANTLDFDFAEFNSTRGKLNTPQLRIAAAMCLDRNAVKKLVYAGTGSSTWGPYPPGSYAYKPEPGYPYDPEKAKSMFAKAGAAGLQFGIEVPAGYPTLSQTATIWQAGLAKAGVNMKVNVSELQVWLDKYIKRTYDITMNTFLSNPDPDYFFSVIMQAHLGDDYPNAAMSKLVQQGAQTLKDSDRAPIYFKLQDMLIRDMPIMMIFRVPFLSVTSVQTTGLAINAEGDFNLTAVTT